MGMAVAVLFAMSGSAAAIASNISPFSQSHAHGVKSNWNLTWGTNPTYDVDFWVDDNLFNPQWEALGTSSTSRAFSWTFSPCTTTTFDQLLEVIDHYGTGQSHSHATETGGMPC